MAQVSFQINAVDRTRAAFASIQQNLRRLGRETDPVQKRFFEMGMRMAGIGSIFAVAGNEVRRVIQDIENIPGIAPETVDSINNAKESFADFRNQVSGAFASVLSFGSEVVTLASVMAGALVYGTDAASDAFWKLKNRAADARRQKEKDAEAARLNSEANKRMADENAAAAKVIANANRLIEDATRRRQSAIDALSAAQERRDRAGLSERQILDALRAEIRAQDELALAAMRAGNSEAFAAAQTARLNAETEALTVSSRLAEEALLDFFGSIEDEGARIANVDKALADFFGGIEEDAARLRESGGDAMRTFGQEMAQMWNGVSDRAGQAFADMVLTGENAFKKLPEMAARAALEIIARMAIINPFLNFLFGGSKAFNILPAFFGIGSKVPGLASGGPVNAGTSYIVGERGPELFVPSQAGRLIPNHQTSGASGSGGPVYQFTYNFAAGVQRAELMPLLKASERSTIARIADVQRRGLPLAAAMA